ncbi:SMEK domain-containing protein [Thiothrix subterranea]|uniref:SMEK domain-containing protein n=1 Tax=Thiothrix subterranea TaxID=2735563 RepID=UPI00192B7C9A|nr:SMEK domain-containing protein [Thiothrix subterranea]QQZ29128.1 SMEK domain-containing protein [Thiothrix subterranea]
MQSQDLVCKIIDYLSILSRKIEMHNSLGFFDVNRRAEHFYADFLNIVFGYELKNLNDIEKNATAIDLYDEKNGISIQVTSEAEISKYRETVEKFVAAELYKKYPTLIVLLITRKKRKHNINIIEINNRHYSKISTY